MKKNKLFTIILAIITFLVVGCGKNEQKFTVTFDTDGGNEIKALEVKKGEKVTKPEDPTKEGYVFEDWCLERYS